MIKFYNLEKVKSVLSFVQRIKPLIIMCMMMVSSLQGYSQFQTPFNQSSLNGDNGFKLSGNKNDDQTGYNVKSAGDVNGDGYDDILVAAPRSDADFDVDPNENSGRVYLIFGKSGNFMQDIDLGNLGSAGVIFRDFSTEQFLGFNMISVNINGDAYSDIVLSGPFSPFAYVVFGKPTGWPAVFDLSSLDGTNGTTISIDVNNNITDLGNAGDVNGDGLDDVVIGSDPWNVNGVEGTSYLVYGNSAPIYPPIIDASSIVFDGITNGFKITGINLPGSPQEGITVNGLGDVNGDGNDDFIVAATTFDNPSEGIARVIFGGQTFTGTFDASALDGTNGFSIAGFAPTSGFYKELALGRIGDINNDGFNDLGIGDYGAETSTFSGSSYVLYGKGTFNSVEDISALDGNNGFELVGTADDRSGISIDGAGDLNNDGIDDLLIGAYTGNRAYIVYGSVSPSSAIFDLSTVDGENGFVFQGSGFLGLSVAMAGDIDNNGINDIIMGAPNGTNSNSKPSGAAYVLFGRAKVTNCAVPTGVAVIALNPVQARVSWNNVNPGEGYEVQYKPTLPATAFESISAAPENNYVDIDVTPGQQYKFKVRGLCAIGGSPVESAFSDFVFLTNTTGCAVPIPDGLGATGIDNEIATLTWNDVNPNGDYRVSYKPIISGVAFTVVDVMDANTLDLTGLEISQDYKFKVQSICDVGGEIVATDFSAQYEFRTASNGCNVPNLLFADAIANNIATLNWADVNPGGDYEVQVKPTIAGEPFQFISVSNDNSLDLILLDQGQQYKFAVRATCDLSGKTVFTEYSPFFYFSTTNTGCDPPTGLFDSNVTFNSAQVNWSPDNPSNNYIVQYKPAISGVAISGIIVTGTSQVLSSLIPNQKYKYRLISVCDVGGGTLAASFYSPWSFFFTDPIPSIAIQSQNRAMDSGIDMNKGDNLLNFEDALTVYPVPARDILKIQFQPEEISGEGTLSVISVLGKEIIKTSFSESLHTSIDLASEKRGVYFVKIVHREKVYTKRFLLVD